MVSSVMRQDEWKWDHHRICSENVEGSMGHLTEVN